MDPIPAFVVEYFLLGKTRRDAMERYTQDGGVGSDVWVAFATAPDAALRVLIAPSKGSSTVLLASTLHRSLVKYRQTHAATTTGRLSPGVSPLESFVAATIHFDELLHVVLPLTAWWHDKSMPVLQSKAARSGPGLDDMLNEAILFKLGRENGTSESGLRQQLSGPETDLPDQRVLQAAPVAALIGVFAYARQNPAVVPQLLAVDPRRTGTPAAFLAWVSAHAWEIATAARSELANNAAGSFPDVREQMLRSASNGQTVVDAPPRLIQRVFLDREAMLADFDAIATIKADAASKLFDVSCTSITWAVIDSGIDASHPAFLDRGGGDVPEFQSRVRAIYDFTRIELIRNFDLTLGAPGSPERNAVIDSVLVELGALPGRTWPHSAAFEALARNNLELIAQQLENQLNPDWNLIEPLIRIEDTDASRLVSDHGTHVAGILGADWRRDKPAGGGTEVVLRGVCPDINFYDLRVIHETKPQSSEFAVLAAVEFVRFINDRAGPNGPVIAGANLSLSIPYNVRTYGCGATPICVACDKLADSGVVVVAAAGNRGWSEEDAGFGNFAFCSITDPGNAQKVITVGATHRSRPHTHGVSYFSSRGPTGDGRIKPDLVAPGEKIRGPVRGAADDELDGTSMAAPFVSGAAALLLARHRELLGDPARVKKILCDTATDLGREKYFQGHGLVDVLRALQSL